MKLAVEQVTAATEMFDFAVSNYEIMFYFQLLTYICDVKMLLFFLLPVYV